MAANGGGWLLVAERRWQEPGAAAVR
jgi:hypothetical protein